MTACTYRELVAAAEPLVKDDVSWSYDEYSREEMADYLETSLAVHQRVRPLLTSPCSASIEYSGEFMRQYMFDTDRLHGLSRSFSVVAKDAMTRKNWALVAQTARMQLDLSVVLRRGSLLIGGLLSMAVEMAAFHAIRRCRRQFNAALALEIASHLLHIDADREPIDTILERDRSWEVAVYGSSPLPRADFSDLPVDDDPEQREAQLATKELLQALVALPDESRAAMHRHCDHRNVALQRMLAIELALLTYCRINGHYPAQLADVSPTLLKSVPVDPFTNRPFVYRPARESFVLYSPGPVAVDHGGVFGHWIDVELGQADLCLDFADYESDVCSTADAPKSLPQRMSDKVTGCLSRLNWRRWRT